MSIFEAIVIAIVEGITEFMPISSTGHMIITQTLLKVQSDEFLKTFIVNIQFGAILSVVVLYWRRFVQSFDFYLKLFVAFIPAAVIGFLFAKKVDMMLGSVLIVAISLIIGGVVLIWSDFWFQNKQKKNEISYLTAFLIGLFQCIALVPGVSRSASTIIGGLVQGLDRKTATEFSFFLAVPTMFAAAAYKLLQGYNTITNEHIFLLLVGNVVSFVVALLAIKTFLTILQRTGFRWFGVYRIIVGTVIMYLLLMYGNDLHLL